MSRLNIRRRIKYRYGGYKRNKSRKGSYILKTSILVILTVAVILLAEHRIASLAIRLGETKLENELRYECSRIAAELMNEYSGEFDSVINEKYGDENRISSVSVDFKGLNGFKGELSRQLTEYFSTHSEIVSEVPAGALLSDDMFAATGMKIPVKITSTATAQVNFTDDFTSGGINQTRHRLMLRVVITAHLHTVHDESEKVIVNEIPITETITVGDVPPLITSIPNVNQ